VVGLGGGRGGAEDRGEAGLEFGVRGVGVGFEVLEEGWGVGLGIRSGGHCGYLGSSLLGGGMYLGTRGSGLDTSMPRAEEGSARVAFR